MNTIKVLKEQKAVDVDNAARAQFCTQSGLCPTCLGVINLQSPAYVAYAASVPLP